MAAVIAATEAHADGSEVRYDFHIDEPTLGQALDAIVRQTNAQLIYPGEFAQDSGVNAVVGRYTVREALDILLEESGFSGGLTSGGTIVVSLQRTDDAERERRDVSTKKMRKGILAGVVSVLFGSPAAAQVDDGADDDQDGGQSPEVEEIVVTGTRIQGVEPAAPSVTFDREDFEQAGFNALGDLFQSLPQNLSEISSAGAVAQGTSRIASTNGDATTSVSLRGLGPESTLTLLNGRRSPGSINGRVVDISAIPLSAIERVEVVTGGGSALYGSDAVAGVVNIVTRRSFSGVEAQVFGGVGDNGGERFQASLVTGLERDRGAFVASYDFSRNLELDATEAGVAGTSIFGLTPIPDRFYLQPERDRHSVFLAGHVELTPTVELYGDALYTAEDIDNLFELNFFIQNNNSEADTYRGTLGLRGDVRGDWTFDLAGTLGQRERLLISDFGFGQSGGEEVSEIDQIGVTFQGTAMSVGGVDVLAALGAERRTELYEEFSIDGDPRFDEKRTVWSAFGELRIPLLVAGPQGMRRLELSAAARYEDFSDFGDTFQPQFGVIWSPADSVTVRATYASAFRAPPLFLKNFAANFTQAFIEPLPDPVSPVSVSPTMTLFGAAQNLEPEEADTFTVALDYQPPFLANTLLSVAYFDISYDDRIDQAAPGTDVLNVLPNEGAFGDLVTRNPTEAEARAFFDLAVAGDPGNFVNATGVPFDPFTQNFTEVFPDLVLFDNRRINIGREDIRGIDLQIAAEVGNFSYGLNGVYYTDYERAVTPFAPFLSQLNRPGRPVDLRLRANAGWSRGALGVFAFLNHTDSYEDPLGATPVEIDGFTTLDATLRFDGSKLDAPVWLDGFSATFTINNVFDEDPPFFGNNNLGITYDPANASALGRFFSLRLVNRW